MPWDRAFLWSKLLARSNHGWTELFQGLGRQVKVFLGFLRSFKSHVPSPLTVGLHFVTYTAIERLLIFKATAQLGRGWLSMVNFLSGFWNIFFCQFIYFMERLFTFILVSLSGSFPLYCIANKKRFGIIELA